MWSFQVNCVSGSGYNMQLRLWERLGHVPGYGCEFCIKLASNQQDGYMQGGQSSV